MRFLPAIRRKSLLFGHLGSGKSAVLEQLEYVYALPQNLGLVRAHAHWLPVKVELTSKGEIDIAKGFASHKVLENSGSRIPVISLEAHKKLGELATEDSLEWLLASPILMLIDDADRIIWDEDALGQALELLQRNGCVVAFVSVDQLPLERSFPRLFNEAAAVRMAELSMDTAIATLDEISKPAMSAYIVRLDHPIRNLIKNPFLLNCLREALENNSLEEFWCLFDVIQSYVQRRLGSQTNDAAIDLVERKFPLLALQVRSGRPAELSAPDLRLGKRLRLLQQNEIPEFEHGVIADYFLAHAVSRTLVNGSEVLNQIFSADPGRWEPRYIQLIKMMCGLFDDSSLTQLIRFFQAHNQLPLLHSGLLELKPERYNTHAECKKVGGTLVDAIATSSDRRFARKCAEALSYYDPRIPALDRIQDGFIALKPDSHLSVGRFPVTNLEYSRFVQANGYYDDTFWTPAGLKWRNENQVSCPAFWNYSEYSQPNWPVVGVSFHESSSYCRWLTAILRQTGFLGVVRLPSCREWGLGLPYCRPAKRCFCKVMTVQGLELPR